MPRPILGVHAQTLIDKELLLYLHLLEATTSATLGSFATDHKPIGTSGNLDLLSVQQPSAVLHFSPDSTADDLELLPVKKQ